MSLYDLGVRFERRELAMVLLLGMIFLLPFGRSSEILVFLMAVAAGLILYRRGLGWFRDPKVRVFTALFLCLWLPILFSLLDSVNFFASLKVTVGYLRWFFLGMFVLYVFEDRAAQDRFQFYLSWILVFWLLDACVQLYLGRDLVGNPLRGGYVTGLFEDLHFAYVLAPLAPVVIIWAIRQGWGLGVGMSILVFFIILATGRRGALLFLLFSYLFLLFFMSRKKYSGEFRKLLVIGLVVGLSGVGFYFVDDRVQQRVDRSLLVLNGDYKSIDKASSQRLPIYEVALDMSRDYWINGVGARAFRDLYQEYAASDDYFVGEGRGDSPLVVTNVHQLVLEISSQTGLLGVLGLIGFGYVLFGRVFRAAGVVAAPYLAGLIAIMIPFNSHHSIYSSFWSQVVFIMIVLTVAHLNIETKERIRD